MITRAAGIVALAFAVDAAADGIATGTVTYKAKVGVVKMQPRFAYLVRGPDVVDNSRIIRRLILSATDVGPRIAGCKTMMCTGADLDSGMTVDLDAGPRLGYWVVLNGQRVQYSGTARPATLSLTTDTPTRLAGKLVLDDSAAGGPQVDVEFDAQLLGEMKRAH